MSDDEKKYPHGGYLPESTVPIAEAQELTLGNMLKGTAANRLTKFERKAALINACVTASPHLAHRA
jgi:hypothetical protein